MNGKSGGEREGREWVVEEGARRPKKGRRCLTTLNGRGNAESCGKNARGKEEELGDDRADERDETIAREGTGSPAVDAGAERHEAAR